MREDEDESTTESAVRPTLWKRAPWWRAALIAAAVLTVAAIALKVGQGPLTTPENAQSAPRTVSSSDEEEQMLAACHPRLAGNPNALPQIDIRNVAQPDVGHIKIHLWINGAGAVVRDTISDASFGTPSEQQAEMDYAKQLTFLLPDKKECRGREIEVIGDVFETRDASGRWATYVKLHPKLFFNDAGILQHAE